MASHKVPVYSTNDLKSTTDDALLPYLCTLPAPYAFKVDYTKSNIRFALGYSAIVIAAFTFYADRKLGWEAVSSPWILAAVVAYFTLNSILTFWLWAVEAGEVFAGKRKSGETITISSSAKKYTTQYKLHVQYKSPAGKVLQDKRIEAPFTAWFSANGIFHPEPFRSWLASEIDVLRLAAKENEKRPAALLASQNPAKEGSQSTFLGHFGGLKLTV